MSIGQIVKAPKPPERINRSLAWSEWNPHPMLSVSSRNSRAPAAREE